MPVDWNTLTIIASVALCSATGVTWLEWRFRQMENRFYVKSNNHAERIQRVELKLFGFTKSP